MARPECPRCGSDLVVAALPGSPSELVEELRGGSVPVRAIGGERANWLCRSCGHRWDPDTDPARLASEPDDLLPEADDVLSDAGVDLDVDVGTTVGLTPPEATHPGALLRRARERRGQTLADAAKGTRIPQQHLRSLESDASLDEFPAQPYARFFLREYAEYLQIEPETLLREFDERHPAPEEPPLQPLPDRRDRTHAVGGALAFVALVALVAIAVLQPSDARDLRPPVDAPDVPPVRVHDSARTATASPQNRPGIRVVLRATEPCWVNVVADGDTVASRTLVPGERVAYRARRDLELRLGNAGGVRLLVDGERVRTGASGEIVTLDLAYRRGDVSISRA